nr:nucleoid-associated protein [Collinsella urealyticum]
MNHAVLHVIDLDSGISVMSDRELDVESRAVRTFVSGHVKRARNRPDARRSTFRESSAFAGELSNYLFGTREFLDIAHQVGEFLSGELIRADKATATDVLIVDCTDDEDARWFAILLLESKQAYMHEVSHSGDRVANDIRRRFAILPNPSQKIASFALIRTSSLEIFYQDVMRKIAGEDRMLIPEGLLECGEGASASETITSVSRAVERVAEDHGTNPAVAVARVKTALVDAVTEDDELPPWEAVDAAFEDEPVMREAVRSALQEEQIPERVAVERTQIERPQVRNQRIKTDTGITISFPAELAVNTDLIEFVQEPNGLLSISLKNIASIENR